ncbi:conserved hypothetical protein [Cryptococcus deneoformans JEC21]|uniref:Fe2OG dioxygenase domain-containing protein n=1 Tax=Cryptococcus deneoformans (strain JEC21 / ATCC MYA-565) TaxID=214684 RepID=Q5KFL2_CRYD1|nr:conserved hypothetical protein [Cryptococcus neoformans var. neoformans JEC21]AAW44206.1 conserved hypothetical protein [Cryptococcus neoformans var. neoformans JEC21]
MTVTINPAASLPIISLAEHNSVDSLARALYDSCTQEGFIYVCDHEIQQDLIDQAFAISANYFTHARPEDKVDLKTNLGYTAVRQESLDSTRPSSGDLKEFFHVADNHWRVRNGESPQELPEALESSRKALDDFIEQINGLADRILRGLSVALKLKPEFLTNQHRGELNRLRMLHYPPVEVEQNGINSDSNEIRAGAHTDYGSITILFQHIVSGLQVHRNGSWIDVAPRKGCVVINIGDALEFWSGGLFKSTLHRVVMPRSQAEMASRYSIAYFVHADNASILEPFTDGIDEDALDEIIARKGLPRGTRRITGGDYVQARLAATYGMKVAA